MASGNYYGELFYGVAKTHLRQISAELLKHNKYEKIVYFAAGSFNIAKAAILSGYEPSQIYCSDISIYSSLLGYLFSNQPISTMKGLELSEEIANEVELADDEFTKVATILWHMRAINLSKMEYRLPELESFIIDKKSYIDQYISKLKKEYEILKGIHYEIDDINNVLRDYGEGTCLIGFPPINKNDYEKIFDYGDAVDLKVDIDMFVPEMFVDMFNQSIGWKSSFLAFTTHRFDDIDYKYIFAAKYNGDNKYDYSLFNHLEKIPPALKKFLLSNKVKPYAPLKGISIFGPDDTIKEDSDISIKPMKAENALFYRSLWIHNLGTTSASSNYGLFVDNKLFAVVGIGDISDLRKMQSDYVFLQYTASAPSNVYTNSVRLLEWCVTCTDFKKLLYTTLGSVNRFFRINGIKTVSITKHKYVKASKGIFKIISREKDKNTGLNKLSEYAIYRKETYSDCVKRFLDEAKYVRGYQDER